MLSWQKVNIDQPGSAEQAEPEGLAEEILLLSIRATHETNWEMHLCALCLMMAWFFAYDRQNYPQNLPCYWLKMRNTTITHRECHAQITAHWEWSSRTIFQSELTEKMP